MLPADQAIGLKVLVVDFELAIHQAFTQVFLGSKISGCLFHFKQCLRNHSDRFVILNLHCRLYSNCS